MNKYLIMGLGSLGILSLFATAFFPMLNFTLHYSQDKTEYISFPGAVGLTAVSGFLSLVLIAVFIISMVLLISERNKKNSHKK